MNKEMKEQWLKARGFHHWACSNCGSIHVAEVHDDGSIEPTMWRCSSCGFIVYEEHRRLGNYHHKRKIVVIRHCANCELTVDDPYQLNFGKLKQKGDE
jgi:rubredoxin